MAANVTAVWRVRPSGANTNGGGFDCSLSATATGTHGSFTGTTFTDATAAAFTSGMAGSSINIKGMGQYLISAYISSTQITLSNGNPGVTLAGPLTWTVGKGNDYSQQNAAQVSQSATANTSTATTTLTDTGAAFTSALIGNGIWVSGTGITTTFTFITAVPSGTTLTLQTSPGAAGTAVSYNIGGAWADFWTNTTSAAGWLVAGNRIYILGSGTPNPSSYTFDYTFSSTVTFVNGSTSGRIRFENDPQTTGYLAVPNATGGMPCIKLTYSGAAASVITLGNDSDMRGLWIVASAVTAGSFITNGNSTGLLFGCVFDQNNCDVICCYRGSAIFSEFFSSVAVTPGTRYVASNDQGTNQSFIQCNFHDCVGGGVTVTSGTLYVSGCLIAKNQLNGIFVSGNTIPAVLFNNTIDGNLLSGINIGQNATIIAVNNIISNHTQAATFGLNCTNASGYLLGMLTDYNAFYNNTANFNNITQGLHDTILGSDPYVAQSTENYTLA